MKKTFQIKIYDKTNTTFQKTLDPTKIRTKPIFSSKIDGGQGVCIIDFECDFGEIPSYISAMNMVRIYSVETTPVLIFTGFISRFDSYFEKGKEGVKINVLGLVSLLSFAYYKNGASFEVSHSSEDPQIIMKAIIDHFQTKYGNLITYGVGNTTIDNVGVNVSIDFDGKKWIDAIKENYKFTGGGWFWRIDEAGVAYLQEKPTTATHIFTLGKDVESIFAPKTNEKIVNQITVKYTGGAVVSDSDATSISNFFIREEYFENSEIQNSTSANQVADEKIAEKKDEKIKATIKINSNYNIESVKCGDTCKIRNIKKGSTTLGENMSIVSVRYNLSYIVIQLEEFSDIESEIKKMI